MSSTQECFDHAYRAPSSLRLAEVGSVVVVIIVVWNVSSLRCQMPPFDLIGINAAKFRHPTRRLPNHTWWIHHNEIKRGSQHGRNARPVPGRNHKRGPHKQASSSAFPSSAEHSVSEEHRHPCRWNERKSGACQRGRETAECVSSDGSDPPRVIEWA